MTSWVQTVFLFRALSAPTSTPPSATTRPSTPAASTTSRATRDSACASASPCPHTLSRPARHWHQPWTRPSLKPDQHDRTHAAATAPAWWRVTTGAARRWCFKVVSCGRGPHTEIRRDQISSSLCGRWSQHVEWFFTHLWFVRLFKVLQSCCAKLDRASQDGSLTSAEQVQHKFSTSSSSVGGTPPRVFAVSTGLWNYGQYYPAGCELLRLLKASKRESLPLCTPNTPPTFHRSHTLVWSATQLELCWTRTAHPAGCVRSYLLLKVQKQVYGMSKDFKSQRIKAHFIQEKDVGVCC